MNICSLLVMVDPARMDEVRADLLRLPGIEIHAQADGGRLVITLEEGDGADPAESLRVIHEVHGVLNAMLIYHYGGDEPLDEEIIRESH